MRKETPQAWARLVGTSGSATNRSEVRTLCATPDSLLGGPRRTTLALGTYLNTRFLVCQTDDQYSYRCRWLRMNRPAGVDAGDRTRQQSNSNSRRIRELTHDQHAPDHLIIRLHEIATYSKSVPLSFPEDGGGNYPFISTETNSSVTKLDRQCKPCLDGSIRDKCPISNGKRTCSRSGLHQLLVTEYPSSDKSQRRSCRSLLTTLYVQSSLPSWLFLSQSTKERIKEQVHLPLVEFAVATIRRGDTVLEANRFLQPRQTGMIRSSSANVSVNFRFRIRQRRFSSSRSPSADQQRNSWQPHRHKRNARRSVVVYRRINVSESKISKTSRSRDGKIIRPLIVINYRRDK